MSTRIEQLLLELFSSLGISPLKLNEDGHCALVIDENLLLDFELKLEQEMLVMTSLIGKVPSSNSADLLSKLMQLNMALYKDLGMCLSIEGHTNTIVLTLCITSDNKTVFDIENALSLFLTQTDQCRHLLEHKHSYFTAQSMVSNPVIYA